jgi:hypothetical protein
LKQGDPKAAMSEEALLAERTKQTFAKRDISAAFQLYIVIQLASISPVAHTSSIIYPRT